MHCTIFEWARKLLVSPVGVDFLDEIWRRIKCYRKMCWVTYSRAPPPLRKNLTLNSGLFQTENVLLFLTKSSPAFLSAKSNSTRICAAKSCSSNNASLLLSDEVFTWCHVKTYAFPGQSLAPIKNGSTFCSRAGAVWGSIHRSG